jgi:glycosyltransferase involved in cell wall biosynthesis
MFKVIYLFRNTKTFFSIENIFRQVAGILTSEKACSCESVTLPRPGFSPVSLLQNARYVRGLSADIYHITGDVHYITLLFPRERTILTIHDCGFLHQNKGIKRWILKKLLLDWPVRHSRLVTTVSQRTRLDIMELTGCPEEKIVVIPNPVNEKIYKGTASFNEKQPVLLFIGTTPNKNLPLLTEAIRGLSCILDIVGKIPAPVEEKLKEDNIVYRNSFNLTDEEIADKYAGSDIIVFPSLFEGFGMPIIEGQRAGRVVITSDLPPMNEVAGGAACLVDPHDPGSVRAGIERVIRDREYREELIGNGFKNAEKYSPQSIAGKYLECYQKISKT